MKAMIYLLPCLLRLMAGGKGEKNIDRQSFSWYLYHDQKLLGESPISGKTITQVMVFP
jgi:hypothetical protein